VSWHISHPNPETHNYHAPPKTPYWFLPEFLFAQAGGSSNKIITPKNQPGAAEIDHQQTSIEIHPGAAFQKHSSP
jgi:hypothetical protein